jgi:peroxiredoxin
MPYFQTTAQPKTDIYFEDSGGGGQPVVLIHGWPLSHRMWESQVNALTAAGYRCLSYDRRGFGESGKATGGYDYDTFASDLNDLVEQQDLRDVVLVGFSMGGGEVARYIGRYGTGRVAKAALLGSVTPFLLKTADNPDGAPQSLFDEMLAGVRKDRVDFLDGFFKDFYNTDKVKSADDLVPFSKWVAWAASPLGTQQCIVAFGTTDFRQDLKKFDVPTLVAHGDKDRIVPIDISGKKAHELIPGSRYEVLKGAPHGFAATHAEALNTLLLDFLKSRS